MQKINLKRIYEPAEKSDGYRIYVDRLYPRGLPREKFIYDEWIKDLAPSTELRHWFHAAPDIRWNEFEERYKEELDQNPSFKDLKSRLKDKSNITLLYSSRNQEHNNAIVMEEELEEPQNRIISNP